MTKPNLPLKQRFLLHVKKTEGCWLWTGTKVGTMGYGWIRLRNDEGVMAHGAVAHRIAYELFVGPIPDGLWVLHRCDTPACVNPEHLFLGNRADNMRDAREKGRIDLSYVGSHPRPGARKVVVDPQV
jgi:hypothetical protein